MLERHYDPLYRRSQDRNFTGYGDPDTYPADDLSAAGIAGIAALYEQVMRFVVPGKELAVDKMPLNFFYLGHIARALPAASIVVLRRHPLDTGLSNFRQLFATGFSYYDYARDLSDIGRYYVQFDRLIAHWRATLPGRVHVELGVRVLVMMPVEGRPPEDALLRGTLGREGEHELHDPPARQDIKPWPPGDAA